MAKGHSVASNCSRCELHKLVSFSEDMRQRGFKPDTQLLGLKQIEAPAEIATALKVVPSDLVYEIWRLCLADGEPMAISTAYIPCAFLPDISEEAVRAGSLFQLLANSQTLHISYAERLLMLTFATPDQAELLNVRIGAALMLLEGPAFLENDQPIEYVIAYYRGDRYEFTFRAVRNP